LKTKKGASMRVLIGDDDMFMRSFLRKVLEEESCEVEIVESGSEVIRRILRQKFDLLFLDIYMGGMDGIEAIPLIKEMDPQLPIVVITGDSSLQIKNKVQNLGVFGYLVKPLNLLEVKNMLRIVPSRSELKHAAR